MVDAIWWFELSQKVEVYRHGVRNLTKLPVLFIATRIRQRSHLPAFSVFQRLEKLQPEYISPTEGQSYEAHSTHHYNYISLHYIHLQVVHHPTMPSSDVPSTSSEGVSTVFELEQRMEKNQRDIDALKVTTAELADTEPNLSKMEVSLTCSSFGLLVDER